MGTFKRELGRAIQECSSTTDGWVKDLVEWVENNSHNRWSVDSKTKGYTGARKTVYEIDSTVNGIHDKSRGIGQWMSRIISFLPVESAAEKKNQGMSQGTIVYNIIRISLSVPV